MDLLLKKIVYKIITTIKQVNMGNLEKAINAPAWLNSKYGIRLVELLSTNPKYSEFSDHIQYHGYGGNSTGIKNLADWIVERAYSVGSDQVVEDLNKYLDSDYIEVYEVSLLANILIKNPSTKEYIFCNGVKLTDAFDIPNKKVSSNILNNLHNSILPLPQIHCILIKGFKQKRFHKSSYSSYPISPNIESPTLDLEETKLCMILARQLRGVHSIASGIIAPDNLPFIQSVSDWRMNSFKLPTIFGYMLDIELDDANNILKKFITLDSKLKNKLKVSIESFNSYCSSSTLVERAISLRTCLESIFLEEKEEYKISKKLKSRGAFFSGNTLKEQEKIKEQLEDMYSISSSAVHNGKISDEEMKKIKVFDEAANIAKNAIIKLINEGEINWQELELK